MTETLDAAKRREDDLKKEVKGNEELLTRPAETQNTFRDTVELWMEGLVNIAAVIDGELAQLGVEDFGYSSMRISLPTPSSLYSSKAWRQPFGSSERGSRSSWPTSRAQSAPESWRRCW